MSRIKSGLLDGRVGKILTKIIVSHAANGTDMPPPMRQRLDKALAKPSKKKNALGVFIWILRHRYKKGHQQTTVNPVGFCYSLAEVEYCLGILKETANPAVSEPSLNILFGFTDILSASGRMAEKGKLQDRRALLDVIDTMLLDFIKAHPDRVGNVGLRTKYALEERTGHDPDVHALVISSLDEAIRTRKAAIRKKIDSNNKPDDLVTALNLQTALQNIGLSPFIAGRSLLALIRDGKFCVRQRVLEFGILGTAEEFSRLSDWAINAFDYTIIPGNSEETQVNLRCQSGLLVRIWHHERYGPFVTMRNHVHVWTHRIFELATHEHGGALFVVPKNYDTYLTERFGQNWRELKMYLDEAFDVPNISYTDRPDSLEYLTNRIVNGLSKNHRRAVTRSVHDLNDYFAINYLPYIPIEGFDVETPASRSRQGSAQLEAKPALLICSANESPKSQMHLIKRALQASQKVDIAILKTSAGGASPAQYLKTYAVIQGVRTVTVLTSHEDMLALQTEYDDYRIICKEGALAQMPVEAAL